MDIFIKLPRLAQFFIEIRIVIRLRAIGASDFAVRRVLARR